MNVLIQRRALALASALALATVGCDIDGFVPDIGTPTDVVVDGDIAFLTSEQFGLSTVDVSNPNAPEVFGAAATRVMGLRLAVSASRAVTVGQDSNGDAGLWVYDRSNPARPRLLGTLMSTDAVGVGAGYLDVAITPDGQWAVIARGSNGVSLVDLSTPSAPEIVSTAAGSGFAFGIDLSADGGHAYVANGPGGLQILEIASSGNLSEVGSLALSGWSFRDVARLGSRVYAANQRGRLYIIDVSNPAAPDLASTAGSAGVGLRIEADSSSVVLLSSLGDSHELAFYSVTSADGDLELVSSKNLGKLNNYGLDVSGSTAYLATGDDGLRTYTLGSGLTETATLRNDFSGTGVAALSDRMIVIGENLSTGTATLRVIDTEDGTAPAMLGELTTNDSVGPSTGFHDVALHPVEPYALLARGLAGVSVVDLTDLERPRISATIATPGTAYGVTLDAGRGVAYVADGSAGLTILDVTNTANIRTLTTRALSDVMRSVAVSGNLAYLASQGGSLKVVDTSNLAAPQLAWVQATSGFSFHVAASSSFVTVLSTTGTNAVLDVYDASNPRRPVHASSRIVGGHEGARGLSMVFGAAIVAAGDAGVKVYDLREPSTPQLLLDTKVFGAANGVAVRGGKAGVADSAGTITIFDCNSDPACRALQNYF